MPTPTKKRRTAASQQVNLRNARSTNWIVAGVLLLFVLTSIVSFSGLYEISSWLGLWQVLWFAAPLFVDGAIVVYKFAEIKLRQDPTRAHLAWKAKLGVLAGTALSSAGNTVHIVSLHDPDPVKYWGGIIWAAASPWGIYLAATVLTDIIVKPKARRASIARRRLEAAQERARVATAMQKVKPTKKRPEKVVTFTKQQTEDIFGVADQMPPPFRMPQPGDKVTLAMVEVGEPEPTTYDPMENVTRPSGLVMPEGFSGPADQPATFHLDRKIEVPDLEPLR